MRVSIMDLIDRYFGELAKGAVVMPAENKNLALDESGLYKGQSREGMRILSATLLAPPEKGVIESIDSSGKDCHLDCDPNEIYLQRMPRPLVAGMS